jgi:hypothetical protein
MSMPGQNNYPQNMHPSNGMMQNNGSMQNPSGMHNGKPGSEVGIEEYRNNLIGILQEFHRNSMYFC